MLCGVLAFVAPIAAQAPDHHTSTVDSAQLHGGPATDPIASLDGKVASLRVRNPVGGPGSTSAAALRTAWSGYFAEPLIVIDGVVSRLTLADVSTDDIEHIDVLSGAAAGALYGLEGSNGVIAITTRHPAPGSLTVSTHLGYNNLPRVIGPILHHGYQLDGSGNYVLDGAGSRIPEADRIIDNPFPVVYDYPGAIVANRLTSDAYLSGGGQLFGAAVDGSVQDWRDAGIERDREGYRRDGARLTVSRTVWGPIAASGNVRYSQSSLDNALGNNPLLGLVFASPDMPFDSAARGNPVYERDRTHFKTTEDRTAWAVAGEYRALPWLSLSAKTSRDAMNSDFRETSGTFEQRERPRTASTFYELAALDRSVGVVRNFDARLSWIEQSQSYLQVASNGGPVGSFWVRQPLRSQLLTASGSFPDGLAVDGLVRRDEILWLPGSKARLFQRLGARYDWRALRVRVAQGTAGTSIPLHNIPAVFCVGSCGPVLAPYSFVRETEGGVEYRAGNGLTLGYTYARKRATDSYLLVPIPSQFQFLWRLGSLATIAGYTHEAKIGARHRLVGVEWTSDITLSRSRARFDSLRTQPFLTGPSDGTTTTQLFRVAPGEDFGTMYGERWIRTPADLQETIDAGRLAGDAGAYRLNEEGYYVDTASYHTINERPLKFYHCTVHSGASCTQTSSRVIIGHANPDFEVGATTHARWRALDVSSTITWVHGGDLYNLTRQWSFNEQTDRAYDQSGKVDTSCPVDWNNPSSANYDPHCPYSMGKKPATYYSTFYDNIDANSYFVERGSYVRVRELAVDWRLPYRLTRALPSLVRDAHVGVAARNLWTSTDYSGYDPQGAASGFGYGGVDQFGYPEYRTVVLRFSMGGH
jgi:TonB-dependent SusC/RagA subfamily outer membrane receptor